MTDLTDFQIGLLYWFTVLMACWMSIIAYGGVP